MKLSHDECLTLFHKGTLEYFSKWREEWVQMRTIPNLPDYKKHHYQLRNTATKQEIQY